MMSRITCPLLLAFLTLAACSEPGGQRRCVTDVDCPGGFICLAGECTEKEACAGTQCLNPPAAFCLDGETLRSFASPGTCTDGYCNYDHSDTPCPFGCLAGQCLTDPCAGKTCEDPPDDFCLDENQLRQYGPSGTCSGGQCTYPYEDVTCPDGCQGGACLGCTPHWTDSSACDCAPAACTGCDGQKWQEDGCGNTRQTGCSLPASGCGGPCCAGACCETDEMCYNSACCAPDCSGRECGPDGCGSECGQCGGGESCQDGICRGCSGCRAGEACIDDLCAPVAVILARPTFEENLFVCPPGYQLAGRWRTGPGAFDSAGEGMDVHDYKIDAGWIWLCSADPARVRVLAGGDDCGSNTSACAGAVRGAWHVGAGCGGVTNGVDAAGAAIQAGWMRLCVSASEVKVEAGHNDCGAAGPGCGAWQNLGAWHTKPTGCAEGDTGVGDSGFALPTGWMQLCADADSFPPADTGSLAGKLVAGYQGWFGTPADGSQRNAWVHWFRGQTPDAASATFDLWPALGEYGAGELYPTLMQYAGGGAAGLYSAYRAETVDRHFRWMARYGLDAAFLQRFVCEIAPGSAGLEFRDRVTLNVVAAA